MANLLRNVTNAIWHAFDELQQEQESNGLVNKTKLKVLTANIATLLDLHGVEKGLDHFRSTATLGFQHFRYYLLHEVFSSVSNHLTLAEMRSYESRIEEICWLVCRKKYLKKQQELTTKKKHDALNFKLFRIFCFLGDLVDGNNAAVSVAGQSQVLLHSSEAALILQQLISALGLDYETDKEYVHLIKGESTYTFGEFLNMVEFRDQCKYIECNESLNEAVNELYQTYIMDVIKKGSLYRKGYLLPTLKEYWFVLQPCELSYYKGPNRKDCGTIQLDPNCMVRPHISNSPNKQDKFLKFALNTGERTFELAALDHRSRLQWIAALQLAITYSTGKEGFQRDLAQRRRKKRECENVQRREEELIRSKHMLEAENTKWQLEKEKQARMAAETQAKELKEVARVDSRRVAELEDIKETLEKLLQEETQAKRDEEIVRALQARVLSEEWEKREELEQLQEEQQNLLELERQKRMEFEEKQKEKEQSLREAEKKLKQLEDERHKLDLELRQARYKILSSGENKEALELRLNDHLKEGDKVRRAYSFMHCDRERTYSYDPRASTLRRPDKICATAAQEVLKS